MREAPEIEKIRMQLLESAKASVDAAPKLPGYQVAGFTKEQADALQRGVQGIGAYQPFMQQGAQSLTAATGSMGEAADILRGSDTRGQFAAAQEAMNLAAQPAAALGNLANVAGSGIGLLDTGAQSMDQAQRMAQQYSQADMDRARGALDQAQQVAQRAGPSDFSAATGQLGQASGTAAQATLSAQRAAQQPGFQEGIGALFQAAQQAKQAGQLGEAPQAQAAQMSAPGAVSATSVSAPTMQAAQTAFSPSLQQFQMGAPERVSTRSFTDAGIAEQFMSPFVQNVVNVQQREALRQADIAGTQRGAQAVRAGAFGGSRQAIMDAEAQRNLAQQLGDIQATGSQAAFEQAQRQFNAEQGIGLQGQVSNQQAGLTAGGQNLSAQLATQQLGTQAGLQTSLANLSSQQQANVQNQAAQMQAQGMNQDAAMRAALANQQMEFGTGQANQQAEMQAELANQQARSQYGLSGAQMGQQAAQMLGQAGQAQIGAANQQGQLGLSAAAQQLQQAGFDANTAMQGAQLQQTQQQQAAQQAGLMQGIGALEGQQAAQAAQLGQGAAALTGQIGGQQAQLAGMYGDVAGKQANILGQQSQLQQGIGQGIGALAGQQFGIGAQMASGMGTLGAQQGNLGVQQGAMGQTAQQLGQQDTSFLFNLGAQQQKQSQAVLDAERATAMQTAMQPMQNVAFLSDIYKGAPSTQMAMTQQATPTPSPFQQLSGTAVGIGATAKALSSI
jgi:hypothetical protein